MKEETKRGVRGKGRVKKIDLCLAGIFKGSTCGIVDGAKAPSNR